MLFIANNNTDPRTNLALEEFLLRHAPVEGPLLLFYVNEPAVIIGRNQNAFEEVDPDYLAANGIQLVRRLSGGGTVYHDRGNLNLSFISPDRNDLHNFAKFTAPIIAVLGQLGIHAELRNRSSLFVGEKKISGNAQYVSRGRVLSHGTLLFDADLEKLNQAIRPRPLPIESKAVQSVRSNVTNICGLLPRSMTLVQFQQVILHNIFGATIPAYTLTAVDWVKIAQIRAERYESWDWNIGRSPKFTIRKSRQFPAGQMAVQIEVDKGHIQHIKIETDFIDKGAASRLADRLQGRRFDRQTLAASLQTDDAFASPGGMLLSEFLDMVT
jgi:lipoate-protein ligase A